MTLVDTGEASMTGGRPGVKEYLEGEDTCHLRGWFI